ncbi:MAG: hypothetical protein K9L24_02605 [Spirochaetia bacterium]|nr:hypothetical protein [Spirochaetia bacterium]
MKAASFFLKILFLLCSVFLIVSCSDNKVLTLVSDPYSDLLFFNRNQQQKIDEKLKVSGYSLNYVMIDQQELPEKTLKRINDSDITLITPLIEDSVLTDILQKKTGQLDDNVYKLNFADGSVVESDFPASEVVLSQNKAWENLGKEITASGSISDILFLYIKGNTRSRSNVTVLKQNLLGVELIPLEFSSEESINQQIIEQQISELVNWDDEYMIICDMGGDTPACLDFCKTAGWKAAVIGGTLLPHYEKSLQYSIDLDMPAAAASIVSHIEQIEVSQSKMESIHSQTLYIDTAWKVITLDDKEE